MVLQSRVEGWLFVGGDGMDSRGYLRWLGRGVGAAAIVAEAYVFDLRQAIEGGGDRGGVLDVELAMWIQVVIVFNG